MNKDDLIREIRTYCNSLANKENALKFARYFKEAPDAYGLSQPQMGLIVKDLLKVQKLDFSEVLAAAPELFRSGKYEEITIALLLVNGFEKQYDPTIFHEIEKWFSYTIHNWAHADTLGMFILPKFLKKNILTIEDFKPWISSSYKFQRRCVPVTFIKILKTSPDFTSIFEMLEPLIQDQEREVHQGMGWFLREAWKIKRSETEAFLLKWKDRAPRLIIQYATEKMTSEEKIIFRRTK
jgi:3-methyladenine DNA glycosylase AlkD